MFESSEGAGRRFFLGYGAAHGAMWRAFLEALESYADDSAAADEAVAAAVATFDEFELWMSENLDLYCDTLRAGDGPLEAKAI